MMKFLQQVSLIMNELPKTFCYFCSNQEPYVKKKQDFVYPSQFESWCTATKKFVKCETRNTKGTCKYYKERSEFYP